MAWSKSKREFIEHQLARSAGQSVAASLPEQQLQWIRDEPGLLDHLIELAQAQEAIARQDRLRFIAMRDGSNRNCETCGEGFVASRSDARYCSSPCRQKAYRART
ncbi:hypothetical protein [Microbacterium oxydans]|uniref:hypothetical protein n=1 Tax=Microbacterium oxydans TaxID=82380 RepID=UPI0024AD4AAA|nr:hypothetical protein [Microbacterium oxydans]